MSTTITPLMRRYVFALYPKPQQAQAMHQQRMMMADLWNALLQRNEDTYRRTRGQRGVCHADGKSRLTFFDMTAEITALRHACPEWEALSVWSAHRVARSLDEAFKAFFRRAKGGAGRRSGYPRFKRRVDETTIPHRCASGCKLLPHEGERSRDGEKARSARDWRLSIKGVSGLIRARGEFPAHPLSFKDADILWRDGRWWFSVCVEMMPRLTSGIENLTISFDLIDQFARVERAEGRRTACEGSARASAQNPNHLNTSEAGSSTDEDAGSGVRVESLGKRARLSILSSTDEDAGSGVRESDQRHRERADLASIDQDGRFGCAGLSARVHTSVENSNEDAGSGVRGDARVERSDVRGALVGRSRQADAADADEDAGSDVRVDVALVRAKRLCELADQIKSARDTMFVRKRGLRPSWRWRRETARAGRLLARAARMRREAIHVWSTNVIRIAADLTIVTPRIQVETESPRGDSSEWGANVQAVSKLNRNTLNQAPAMAAQMLAYKAAEAGIRCDVVRIEDAPIVVGSDLVKTGKLERRAKRALKRRAA